MKYLSLGEAETKRRQAVDFLRRIGNDDAADQYEAMDAKEYAEHKGAELVENPKRRSGIMARTKSKEELQAELDEANDYIEQLEAKMDDIAGIAGGDEEDEDDDNDDNGADDDDADDGDEDSD